MWVDLLVSEILAQRPGSAHLVNDAKTPSGTVHVGSLRGVILHDCIARGLREAGVAARYLYGFDDYDPMDGLPPNVPPDYVRYMGMPLSNIPAPDGSDRSYGRQFGEEFAEVFNRLGAHAEIYWTSEMYLRGNFDDAIRTALDRSGEIVAIVRETSGSRRADPQTVQVLCEHCGRIGTTIVLGWDGREVAYECRPDKVPWAQGCGHRGRRSPFRGGSKLQYRTEWAAKWKVLGVTVEGAGKDHMTRGGSHDSASAISERVFGYPTPFPIAYEFFLVGGRKMKSSRGLGVPAREVAEILRPDLARFLIVRPHFKRQINFDPSGETIPNLYDEYDRAADAFFGRLDDPDLSRDFHYGVVDAAPADVYLPRFAKVANLIQMPTVDVAREIGRDKGSPLSPSDRFELDRRISEARAWLATYAPDHYRFEVQPTLPAAAAELGDGQREFLARVAGAVAAGTLRGDELHARIHDLRRDMGLDPKAAFGAIYLAFLGKTSGPQAGWFLAALDRDFVIARLREAARSRT